VLVREYDFQSCDMGGAAMNSDWTKTNTTRRLFLKVAGGASAIALGGLSAPAIAQGAELTIISAESNAGVLAVLRRIAADFEKQSGTKVVVNNMDHEAHKTAIRNYLVAGAPDICF